MSDSTEDSSKYIGVASLRSDGAIVLRLRFNENGLSGEGMLVYKKEDPDYAKIMAHVGPLEPGVDSMVLPFDDD